MYLDLEGTIIKDWFNKDKIINERGIRNLLKEHLITEIGIFSFAIYTVEEVREFKEQLQETLENLLGVKIVKVLTLPEIMSITSKVEYLSIYDFLRHNDKYSTFHRYCKSKHKGEMSMLIDDMVPTSCLTLAGDPETIIYTFNVNDLKDRSKSTGLPTI